MKTFHFHPASLLAGLTIGAGFLFLTSQTSTATFPTARVEVGPHPRDMVQILGGVPYPVPPGRLFVLTALGSTNPNGNVVLKVNGVNQVVSGPPTTRQVWMQPTPTCFTAQWGSVVEIDSGPNSQYAHAWGYLAER